MLKHSSRTECGSGGVLTCPSRNQPPLCCTAMRPQPAVALANISCTGHVSCGLGYVSWVVCYVLCAMSCVARVMCRVSCILCHGACVVCHAACWHVACGVSLLIPAHTARSRGGSPGRSSPLVV